MIFNQNGIDPDQEKFNIKAIKTLIFENRPLTFGKVLHNILNI